jgi:pilus assembly protein FimV
MKNKTTKISGLLLSLLIACGVAQGAGLGKLSVQSALGQPLKAEIELLSVTKDELPGVSARLASTELFRQARIERSGALAGLEFEVAQRANGQPVVRITSKAPMSDPFLDLLIELNWSTGRIIREYTVLLDPPTDARAPAQVAAVKPATPVAGAATAREAPPGEVPKPATEAAKPSAKPVPKAPPRYGPVKPGETLRSIAGRVKAPEVTLEQMMVGLYLSNKGAFIGHNMNLLKKGAVLNVPASEAVHLQASPSQAMRMIQEHVEEWHAYRSKVAEVAGEVPEAKAEGQAAGGKITPKVEEKTPAATAPKDVLKLSKGEPAMAGKADTKTQERLQALEEELAAKSRALQESQERVSQLERAVRDMQQLLQLKSQEAAKAGAAPQPQPQPPQQAAPAKAAPPAEPAAAKAPPAKPAPAPALPPAAKEEESSWLSTFISNPLYIGGVVAAGLLSGLLWMMMVGNRRRQGLNKFEDSIMTGGEFKSGAVFNTGGTAGEATAATANTGGSMLTDFSRLGLGAIDSHEVDPIAEAEVYMAYGRDAQAEEILKEALEKDSSRHEVALKLLEIYAARKDPLAFETTASELYAGLGGQDTPIWQRAAEMGRSIDPENPLYRMAQGQSFASAPAMSAPVAQDAAPAAAQDSAEDMGMAFVTSEAAPAPQGAAQQAPAPEFVAQDQGLDFISSFDLPAPEVAVQEMAEGHEEPAVQAPAAEAPGEFEEVALAPQPGAPEEGENLTFGLGELEPKALMENAADDSVPEFHIETEAPEEASSASREDLAGLDLETVAQAQAMPDLDFSGIDLEMEAAPAEAPAAVEEPGMVEEPGVVEEPAAVADLDFEPVLEAPSVAEAAAPVESEAAPTPGMDPVLWEEVNTKLDLARAYLEMGDREGAREILQEVTQEGDAQQKSEAEKLLSEAG